MQTLFKDTSNSIRIHSAKIDSKRITGGGGATLDSKRITGGGGGNKTTDFIRQKIEKTKVISILIF